VCVLSEEVQEDAEVRGRAKRVKNGGWVSGVGKVGDWA